MVESAITMVGLDFLLCLGLTIGRSEENVVEGREGEKVDTQVADSFRCIPERDYWPDQAGFIV
jgi:hypothetical protein